MNRKTDEITNFIDAQMGAKIDEILVPSVDIANAAFALVIHRSQDLDVSPLVCLMILKHLCDMNVRNLVNDKQQFMDKFVEQIPGLKKYLNPEHTDMYKLLDETVAKLIKGGALRTKTGEL